MVTISEEDLKILLKYLFNAGRVQGALDGAVLIPAKKWMNEHLEKFDRITAEVTPDLSVAALWRE